MSNGNAVRETYALLEGSRQAIETSRRAILRSQELIAQTKALLQQSAQLMERFSPSEGARPPTDKRNDS